ncbi:ObirOr5-A3 [Ooceraea biroi]|uniref:Odorant receptor n=1 Tax=Ooceraea biroi TaxID=2015173 RepID=A0A026X0E5_OOCBI|nr:uncharacterized protein LOC105283147 [Ooceraea biroi]EZA61770.1 hypothetical protein X777_09391 [Ooceraea biroi]RLU23727.1 ObirOr5-A3 [Ooceraea biroi]
MDFQNVNPLNIRLNKLSGNLLPMTDRDSSFTLLWKLYGVFVTVTELLLTVVLIPGCIYVSRKKLMQDGLICLATTGEMAFMIVRIHKCRDLVRQLIRRLNGIMYVADKNMRNIVTKTLKPTQVPLMFYTAAGMMSTITWCCLPFVLIFEKSVFWNEDYKMPAFFPKQPFSLKIFILNNLFIMLGCIYMILKKIAADVYMIHLVLLMTAQYQYIAMRLTMIFHEQNEHGDTKKKRLSEINQKQEREMMALCRHHNAVIHIMFLLKKLLASNFSLIYMINILRFCFIGVMLSGIPSTTFWEAAAIFLYASGSVVQLYVMCSCVQKLLDASMEITDKAFHEGWYFCKPSIKWKFMLIIMANNLECKIAKIENFNLSLPSFMKILNQSYSIALVFLRFK